MAKVSPSILAADFSSLGKEVYRVGKAADMIHFDVMDGLFVPNITFGPAVLASIRRHTALPIEAHLMIQKPSGFLDRFAVSGATFITVHVEADSSIRTLKRIRELGALPGIALNPSTPVSAVKPALGHVSLVLVMTVNPGFGGQGFIMSSISRIRQIRSMILEQDLDVLIEVDGGINLDTAKKAVGAGADVLVAGSYVYGSRNPAQAINALKKLKCKDI
ncbi:ribulose-phosphate 3-epimerase [Candidatus Woesearchaeota archaeon]|nr:ribulose-phosphate 3-epimerase [Candidatus Woesearchaeota archaeon]